MIDINAAPPAAGQARPVVDDILLSRYDRPVPRYTSYPTAPHFVPLSDGDYAEWLAALPPGTEASLYLHVPFCRALCLFCGCHMTVVNKPAPIAAYAATLRAEIGLLARSIRQPLLVRHLHWGGGTPTALGPEEFVATMSVLARHFRLDEAGEIAVEIDPRTLSEAMAAALRAGGVTRASLGVQDFDPLVQRTVNRLQPFEQVAAATESLRRNGIAAINFDLMYGLPYQTEAKVAETARRALQLRPDRLAVFGYAHVPRLKRHQALLPEAALPGAHERFRQQAAVAQVLTGAGYVPVGFDHFARPGDPLAEAAATGRLRRNFQGYTTDRAPLLLGIGASAIGSLPGAYVQNAAEIRAWRAAVQAGRLPAARGLRLSAEDRLRRELIEQVMCRLAVDLEATARRHGAPPRALVSPSLERLAADGLIHWDGRHLEVTPAGRPFLRTIAAAFDAYYDPETEPARYCQGV